MEDTVNGLSTRKADSNRSFYDLSQAYKSRVEHSSDDFPVNEKVQLSLPTDKQSFYESDHSTKLCAFIDDNVIGKDFKFTSPFSGKRQVVYCDYTASGKALHCIEDYLLNEVLPSYGNTHTTTSVTSLQTTLFRHEAREIFRNSVGASEDDAVIFVGSGCTGAVHKLVNGLNLSKPPIVFVGASEHHSNLLPWREIAAQVIRIEECSNGLLNLSQLEDELKIASKNSNSHQLIGCFSAASNITGTLNQDLAITSVLHRYGALAFWDYATAAPYVRMKMNPTTTEYSSGIAHKDAMYFSMHKFVGGVQTPGVLIVKKSLLRNHIPNGAGGGTVFFVDRDSHRYLRDAEMREEGGTPAIVESIRAGLVLKLKDSVTADWIMQREEALVQQAYSKWLNVPEIILLGSTCAPRLSIFSFLIRHPATGYFLHHNFVCALLNDLFGIQARGGCACAGPYALDLLGIDAATARRYEDILVEDHRLDRTHLRRREECSCFEIVRPGFSRLNLPYFSSDAQVDFVLQAVIAVAKRGWTLLPQYQINHETGEYHHQSQLSFKDRKWLGYVDFQSGKMRVRNPKLNLDSVETDFSYEDCLMEAELIFDQAAADINRSGPPLADQRQSFNAEAADLRWFLLPSEAQEIIRGETVPSVVKVPFTPRQYSVAKTSSFQPQHYSTVSSTSVTTNGHEKIGVADDPDREPTADTEVNNVIESHHDDGKDFNGYSSDEVDSENFTATMSLYDEDDDDSGSNSKYRENPTADSANVSSSLWKPPIRSIMKPCLEALIRYKMISNGDKVLVCVSGGKDSLSLLHTLRQYKLQSRRFGIEFELGAMTVDPGSSSYDPSPLIPYMQNLGIPYFYEKQCIITQAMDMTDIDSICSFCSRLKRGRIYQTARKNGYNVIALGQHLDDLAESFLMSTFHNGRLRTMKAAYVNRQRDLKIIRPFVYVRERELRHFATQAALPVIPENCPACFEEPKERHRIKQLLAQQELLYPCVYLNIKTSLLPLMSIDQPFVEKQLFGKQSYVEKKGKTKMPQSQSLSENVQMKNGEALKTDI